MAAGLAAVGLCSMAGAVLLGAVARHQAARIQRGVTANARRAFAVFWGLMAATLLNDALRTLMGLGTPHTGLYLTLSGLKIFMTAAALAALAIYVDFLWSGHYGRQNLYILAAVLFASYFGLSLLLLLPAHVEVDAWSTRLVLLGEGFIPVPPALRALVFFAPGLALAIAYGALYSRLPDDDARSRMRAVVAAMALVFVVGSVQFSPAARADSPAFLGFGLLTVLASVVAYRGAGPRHATAMQAS